MTEDDVTTIIADVRLSLASPSAGLFQKEAWDFERGAPLDWNDPEAVERYLRAETAVAEALRTESLT